MGSSETWYHHMFQPWGVDPGGTRVVAAESVWEKPMKWNSIAGEKGGRHKVFCADVFEGPETMPTHAIAAVRKARVKLFDEIARTPHLDWLLLTNLPNGVLDRIEEAWHDSDEELDGHEAWSLLNNWLGGTPPPNVWTGTIVENQAAADERIPHLLRVPAAVLFLYMPLVGPVDLTPFIGGKCDCGRIEHGRCHMDCPSQIRSKIGWVIVGGESGPGARPCNIAWIRSVVRQCRLAGVKVFVEQLGSNPVWTHVVPGCSVREFPERFKLKDPKGADPAEWPEVLQVREWPE